MEKVSDYGINDLKKANMVGLEVCKNFKDSRFMVGGIWNRNILRLTPMVCWEQGDKLGLINFLMPAWDLGTKCPPNPHMESWELGVKD